MKDQIRLTSEELDQFTSGQLSVAQRFVDWCESEYDFNFTTKGWVRGKYGVKSFECGPAVLFYPSQEIDVSNSWEEPNVVQTKPRANLAVSLSKGVFQFEMTEEGLASAKDLVKRSMTPQEELDRQRLQDAEADVVNDGNVFFGNPDHVDELVDNYNRRYPPQGYGTRSEVLVDKPDFKKVRMSRYSHCD
jgi:hypothetical protein